MMTMSGRVMSCCVALILVLSSVLAVQKNLHSLDDLKQIDFGQSVPKHSLLLLHWFANTVNIDNNKIIWLTFNPVTGDYGSHHYRNSEGLLDPLHRGGGHRYYTIGNLYRGTTVPLPRYVVYPSREYVGRNRDRIIICVREENTEAQALPRIDQVYLTQHYDTSEHQGTPYDPDHTYRITTNLLRQIREFSVGENQQQLSQLRNRYRSNADELHIRKTWGDLACLGLLLFIVIQEKYSSTQQNNRPQNNYTPQNRPQSSYTPQNNRPQSSYTPQNNRPQNNYTPQNNRPQSSYTPQNNRPENRRTHQGDNALESARNVPRYVQNHGDVAVDIDDDEDQEDSRTTWNRESGRYNISKLLNAIRCCCVCCICCISLIFFFVLCIILIVFLYRAVNMK